MKIVEIVKGKRSSKYSITFENGDLYKLSLEQIVKHKLKQNIDVDYEYFKDILIDENNRSAFNKALDYIKLRDYTSFEIKNKLHQKEYDEDSIFYAINKLIEYNFINDKKYAENYAADSLKYKKYGKTKIIYTLKQKGISNNIISSIDFNLDDEYDNALALALKKLKSLKEEPKRKEKLYRYLGSRGYSNDVIFKVIREVLEETF